MVLRKAQVWKSSENIFSFVNGREAGCWENLTAAEMPERLCHDFLDLVLLPIVPDSSAEGRQAARCSSILSCGVFCGS